MSTRAGEATLLLVGDVNIQRRARPVEAFERVRDALHSADVLFGNLEGPLAEPSPDPAAPDIPHKARWTHSGAAMVEGLLDAGFDAVGCANNVTYPPRAMLESLAVLDQAGILHCGGGANLEEARRPVVVARSAVRFGFVQYTSVFWPVGHAAGLDTPGVATVKAHTAYAPHPRVHEMPGGEAIVRTWPDDRELAAMCEDVRRLRERADVVVASYHWGISGSRQTADYQRAIARAAVDAGADVVIGHGPHEVQRIEVYRGRPIFYSLANFAFDWESMRKRTDGLLVRVAIRDRRPVSVAFVPLRRDAEKRPVLLDPTHSAGREIADLVSALSVPYETTFSLADGAVLVGGVWPRA